MLYNYFPLRVRDAVKQGLKNNTDIEEIRVRCGQNITFCSLNSKCFLDKNGNLIKNTNEGVRLHKEDLKEMFKYFTQNSVYAMQQDIKSGFITLPDGTRVGICGRCITKCGIVENINDISSFNIRLSRQIDGWGNNIFNKFDLAERNVLIIAPPGYGKTTLLRNMIKYASDMGKNVSVIDERSEISPFSEGARIYDLGLNTDVLSDIYKKEGINIMLKTMNPEIIATDEILSKEDFEIINNISVSGVKIFATFHGITEKDYFDKARIFGITKTPFDCFLIISKNHSGRTINYRLLEEI